MPRAKGEATGYCERTTNVENVNTSGACAQEKKTAVEDVNIFRRTAVAFQNIGISRSENRNSSYDVYTASANVKDILREESFQSSSNGYRSRNVASTHYINIPQGRTFTLHGQMI